MRVKNEVVYDWTDYTKIGLTGLFVILALFAMFSSSTSRVPPSLQIPAIAQPAGQLSPTVAADQPAWWILLITGLAIGCYGTIVGIGGGPIILPLLVFFYGWENELLVATSLFIVLLNASSGCAGYAAQKRIDYTGGIKFTLAAMPGALISSFTHHLVNLTFFDHIFGIFLIFLAVYTFFSVGRIDKTTDQKQKYLKEAKASGFRRVKFIDQFGVKYDFYANDGLGISMNILLGFFCGFLGIGEACFRCRF